ncbi:hypothetical protein OUZ56_025377 [Daphnia magna]|uniref:Uncharacterized protein n=1 Tax=Daphnia magna TaxID=35525 RepID=A0ABQ9ZJP3_9CRUS|nr:hypothetical protein OUZ56_025377 [Daphnia magna]
MVILNGNGTGYGNLDRPLVDPEVERIQAGDASGFPFNFSSKESSNRKGSVPVSMYKISTGVDYLKPRIVLRIKMANDVNFHQVGFTKAAVGYALQLGDLVRRATSSSESFLGSVFDAFGLEVKGVVLVFVGTCMQTMAGFSNRPYVKDYYHFLGQASFVQ